MAKVKTRIEQSDFDKKFYAYREVDVSEDDTTTENTRFEEVGSFKTEDEARAALA